MSTADAAGSGAPGGPEPDYTIAKPDWQDRAACRSFPLDLFFTAGSSDIARYDQERAKAVCETCPVRVECLDWALATEEQFGVWGGLTADERRALTSQSH